ncbi:UbiH/UbiF family hydroxylase [Rhodobacteraceae bacterium RKSG542]|uniref:UbiH/UbiF family hydroxylase n=1 Tax=Pseudovibrio flavus TaxID=2529854 RepID=UPI0012BBA6B6|nr:UbiH/UbiF family hydroxylase [Pseudovibrio flavus]MTI17547.1 UbiH/UbiF family hydroxylase [Pseudovibrio flavus]
MAEITEKQYAPCAIVGTGPAGMIAALSLSAMNIPCKLIGPPANLEDMRTTALMDASVAFLQNMGLWQHLAMDFTPLRRMRLIDATGRLIRAPETTFDARELDLEAFGYNIKNNSLNETLWSLVQSSEYIEHINGSLKTISTNDLSARLILTDGSAIDAGVVIGADGRNSPTREAAGIETTRWSYPQSALVLNVSHSLPHNFTSTEFHQATGPLTFVPLPGNDSSVVCVVKPEEGEALFNLSKEDLALELERRASSVLGAFEVISTAQLYPMSGLRALKMSGNRSMLVGEAAHAFPPIGAQGLNLSLRDIAVAVDLIVKAGAKGERVGDAQMIEAYHNQRSADVITRTNAVDLLNRSLLSAHLPVQMVRAVGLYGAANLPFLRKLLMREGIAPSWNMPRLMIRKGA